MTISRKVNVDGYITEEAWDRILKDGTNQFLKSIKVKRAWGKIRKAKR